MSTVLNARSAGGNHSSGRSTVKGVGITADTREMRLMAKKLLAAAPEVWAACQAAMRDAVEPVRADAANRAAAVMPNHDAKVRVVGHHASLAIKAGGAKNPLPALMETGQGNSLHWRHPVYNRGGWAAQDSRPYLVPAMIAHRGEVAGKVEELVIEACHRALD